MVDVSDGTRELVDISAEAVQMLGQHLHQIGDLIGGSKITEHKPGERTAAQKIREKFELFAEYQDDKKFEAAQIERRINEDWDRMREWRKYAGNEGASLLEELQSYIKKVKFLKAEMEIEAV